MRLQLGEHWQKPINGQGGLQNLLKELVKRADADGQVVLIEDGPYAEKLVERVKRYRKTYGAGGFQGRIGTVLEE